MALTKEQWQEVEKKLSGFFGSAKFSLGEREITVERGLIDKDRLGFAVYIDGWIKGEWHTFNGEEMKEPLIAKVWCPRVIKLYKPSEKARIIKALGKRYAKKLYPNLEAQRVYFSPHFGSFRALKSVLSKLEELELKEYEPRAAAGVTGVGL
ncbi:MAG: hypothetical protein ACK4L8_10840 [Nitrincola lacisaponensis]|uniref:hypothetical protein n=1 Tax=Nitrincola lacisaponensis TaxID=267850 RepID=UPI00391A723E